MNPRELYCPLCHERTRAAALRGHLYTAHEHEMEQRHRNPDDPVVAELQEAEKWIR